MKASTTAERGKKLVAIHARTSLEPIYGQAEVKSATKRNNRSGYEVDINTFLFTCIAEENNIFSIEEIIYIIDEVCEERDKS